MILWVTFKVFSPSLVIRDSALLIEMISKGFTFSMMDEDSWVFDIGVIELTEVTSLSFYLFDFEPFSPLISMSFYQFLVVMSYMGSNRSANVPFVYSPISC